MYEVKWGYLISTIINLDLRGHGNWTFVNQLYYGFYPNTGFPFITVNYP